MPLVKKIRWTNKWMISQNCSKTGVNITTRTILIKTKSSKFKALSRVTTLWVNKINSRLNQSVRLNLISYQVINQSDNMKLKTICKLQKSNSWKLNLLIKRMSYKRRLTMQKLEIQTFLTTTLNWNKTTKDWNKTTKDWNKTTNYGNKKTENWIKQNKNLMTITQPLEIKTANSGKNFSR